MSVFYSSSLGLLECTGQPVKELEVSRCVAACPLSVIKISWKNMSLELAAKH